jgi:alkyl sulfatase BDS1-like metallo-beta-lactamase superfamily hydrolase
MAITDAVSQFFESLAGQGHVTTFEAEAATLRFDVADDGETEYWHLTVANGGVTVTRQQRTADAVVRVQRPQLEAMLTGRLNAQAALLRGLVTVHGKMAALMMFQRCLPGPPGSTGRAAPISGKTVMSWRRPT